MKKIVYTLSLLVSAFVSIQAQTVITQWDFNSITPGDIATATPSIGAGTVALVGGVTTPTSGPSGVGSTDQSATNSAFQTTTYPAQGVGSQSAGVQFNVSTTGYENIKLIFDLRLSNTSSRWVQVQYTVNGATWQNFGTPNRIGGMGDDDAGDAWHNGNEFDFSAISAIDNNANFGVRVVSSFSNIPFTLVNTGASFGANEAYEPARNPSSGTSSNYGGGTMRYDMVTFEGSEIITGPTIVANPTALSNFTQLIGSPSDEQSFVVSASNLTGDLSIQAPTGYQISLTSGGMDWESILSLSPNAGTIAATTIYVRLNSAVAGDYNGNIVLSSAGATTVNVALSGVSSLAPFPQITVAPTGLSGFEQILGTPSAEQTIAVSGINLNDDITATAPTGYEVSLLSGSGFGSAVVLSHTGGTVDPTQVYVRLNHNVVGSITENLILSTPGLVNIAVSLTGSVEAPLTPLLGVSPLVLNHFNQNLGFPSASQLVTVGGQDLTSDITITCNSNFFIGIGGGSMTQSLTLTPAGGYVDPTQIMVHLNANNVGESVGALTITTAGTDVVTIDLTGTSVQQQGSLLYYWHFNNLETPVDVTTIDADYSLIAGVTGKFDYTNPFEGQRDMDAFDMGSSLNVQMGEGSGKACRVRNTSTDRTLDFFVPTNNATGIRLAYAVHRSGSGMLENIISYSLNGTDFITTDLENNTITATETYELHTLDFSGINGANNNPNFRIRISFNGNTVAANGNNRFDNITLTADSYSNLETNTLPLVTVYPNPTEDVIYISSQESIQNITLVDLNGREVLNSQNIAISLSKLQSGIYFLLIQTNFGIVQKSIVKK